MQEYFNREEVKRLFKLAGIAVILLTVFLAVKTLGALRDLSQPTTALNTIVVTGEGEAFASPDVATFSFTVSTDAKTVGGAQDVVTGKTNSIVEALKALGIEDKDIRTTDYSVYPKYTYEQALCTNGSYCPPGRQIPDGYTVSNSVSIKVRKTADAGQALSVVGAKGATNISSLSFTIDDPNSIQNQARDEAVAQAREKAQALAKSLGVSLGRVVDFSDSSNPGPYPVMYGLGGIASSADSKAVSISTGQNKITSNVTITYEIR